MRFLWKLELFVLNPRLDMQISLKTFGDSNKKAYFCINILFNSYNRSFMKKKSIFKEVSLQDINGLTTGEANEVMGGEKGMPITFPPVVLVPPNIAFE